MNRLYAVVETTRCRIETYESVIAIYDSRSKADAYIASKDPDYDTKYYIQEYQLNGEAVYE